MGGPAHARPALLAILTVAALLFTWDIQHSGYHAFYAQTARSMSESWKGFLFGSFDPGNSITIDKLPGFLWPQALSARIFGFHPWALTLPQAIEGVLSVAVLYRAVRRWAGESAGLLAAGAFALTPAVAGLFRTQAEDPAFTLLVLLAADATLRAARRPVAPAARGRDMGRPGLPGQDAGGLGGTPGARPAVRGLGTGGAAPPPGPSGRQPSWCAWRSRPRGCCW